MRKTIHLLAAILLVASLLCSSAAVLAESTYVSINDIRATIPERWTGEYVTNKGDGINVQTGDTIFIDTPIVVPEVDAVPIVRITWGGPVIDLDKSLRVIENTQSTLDIWNNLPESALNAPPAGRNISVNDSLSWNDAPNVLIEQMKKHVPSMKEKTLEYYYMRAYGDNEQNGGYRVCYYSSFHGIPYLVAQLFQIGVESECVDGQESVPFNMTYGWIKNSDQFYAGIHAPQELGTDIEDVPLLPFAQIEKAFEKRITDGYIHSLNEISFGYIAFIDPQRIGEEFLLRPPHHYMG